MIGMEKNSTMNVFTDLLEADQSCKDHVQKLFNTHKLQTEKDNLVDSMAFHLSKHRPVVKRTAEQKLK